MKGGFCLLRWKNAFPNTGSLATRADGLGTVCMANPLRVKEPPGASWISRLRGSLPAHGSHGRHGKPFPYLSIGPSQLAVVRSLGCEGFAGDQCHVCLRSFRWMLDMAGTWFPETQVFSFDTNVNTVDKCT